MLLHSKSPFSVADSILLLGINVPTFVREGGDANLTCVYDLEGTGLYRYGRITRNIRKTRSLNSTNGERKSLRYSLMQIYRE